MFTVTVTADVLHMRQGPGTSFDSTGFVHKGNSLIAVAIDGTGTWLQVKEGNSDGKTGWCRAHHLFKCALIGCSSQGNRPQSIPGYQPQPPTNSAVALQR